MIKGINEDQLEKSWLVVRALRNDLRQQVLDLIVNNPGISVTDIYVKLRLEQSVASQHLAILRGAGLVTTERVGKSIHYSVNTDAVVRIGELVTLLSEFVKTKS